MRVLAGWLACLFTGSRNETWRMEDGGSERHGVNCLHNCMRSEERRARSGNQSCCLPIWGGGGLHRKQKGGSFGPSCCKGASWSIGGEGLYIHTVHAVHYVPSYFHVHGHLKRLSNLTLAKDGLISFWKKIEASNIFSFHMSFPKKKKKNLGTYSSMKSWPSQLNCPHTFTPPHASARGPVRTTQIMISLSLFSLLSSLLHSPPSLFK